MSESIAGPQDAPEEQSPHTTLASPSPASKIHEGWKDDSLDALLVSSDGVGFYVPAYQLQAHRQVISIHCAAFCDIITGPAKGQSLSGPSSSNSKGASGNTHHTLELTDKSFETSRVVAWCKVQTPRSGDVMPGGRRDTDTDESLADGRLR
ncbi:hypothetical protein B9479_007556 [Cryptococcus floricola]|uniref:Uncharacterized protein n=1 Tax=Cryptococcus floricola TaxID=2591691 RepID=A0A5D3AMG4_9TREE|nr:hypothetical protein B9479_007556 [Cryptococcus floricola]